MKDINGVKIKVGDIVVLHAYDSLGEIGEVKEIYKNNEGCGVEVDHWGKLFYTDDEIEVIGNIKERKK